MTKKNKKYLVFLFLPLFGMISLIILLQTLLATQHQSISTYLKLEEFTIERTIRITLTNLLRTFRDSLQNQEKEVTWIQNKVHEVIPNYNQLDDFEKVRRIRAWVHSWVNIGGKREKTNYSWNFADTQPIDSVYEGFENNELSVLCGGTATTLKKIYRLLGFSARTYDFGLKSPKTHVLTLVRVQGEEYIQDAYGNYEILDEKRKPLSFGELLSRLQQKRHDFQISYDPQTSYSMNIEKYFQKSVSEILDAEVHPLYALFFPIIPGNNNQFYADILKEYTEPLNHHLTKLKTNGI